MQLMGMALVTWGSWLGPVYCSHLPCWGTQSLFSSLQFLITSEVSIRPPGERGFLFWTSFPPFLTTHIISLVTMFKDKEAILYIFLILFFFLSSLRPHTLFTHIQGKQPLVVS